MLLLLRAPVGPLRTAGSAAAVLAVPALLLFLTFDDGNTLEPFSGDVVVLGSAAAWLALHQWGPAAGRTFPLAAGLVAAWLGVLQLVESDVRSPLDLVSVVYLIIIFGVAPGDEFFGEPLGGPDTDALAAVSLVFGFAAIVIGRRLERAGEAARATAFAAASVVILLFGGFLLVGSLELVGAGLALAAIGVVLAGDGASRQRRGTAWSGGVIVVAGAVLALVDLAGDSATSFGLAAAVVGTGIVVGGWLVTSGLGEPDELEVGPSTFRTKPAVAPPPPPPQPPPA